MNEQVTEGAQTMMSRQAAWVLSGTGGLALLTAFLLTISNNASIALDVARQHGEELNEIRILQQAFRTELMDRTADRYTAIDAARDMAFLERRLQELEDKIIDHKESH